MKKIVIFGSRSFTYLARVAKVLDEIKEPFEIVSGMAKGVDSLAVTYGEKRNILVHKFPAKWSNGNSAGMNRNEEMADFADEGIAFWDGLSTGTEHMINHMRSLGKKVTVYDTPIIKSNGHIYSSLQGFANVYCGRQTLELFGSPLANPFVMRSENDRGRVCAKYEDYLLSKLESEGTYQFKEMDKLYNLVVDDGLSVNLQCWCEKGKQCHTDFIKELLDSALENNC